MFVHVPARHPAAKVKPKLRGMSHQFAFVAALGGLFMLSIAPVEGARHTAGVVYGLSLVLTLGISALYHRPMWSLAARRRLQRVDHSGIAVLIAGTYTPLALLDGRGHSSLSLWVMWAAAGAAICFALFWSARSHRALRAGVYVALGFVALPLMLRLPALVGFERVLLMVLGAALYAAGAMVYAFRWPNPRPAIFGYHEVFHLFVIAAAAVQFGVLLDVQQHNWFG